MDAVLNFLLANFTECFFRPYFWIGLALGFFAARWFYSAAAGERKKISESDAACNIATVRNEILATISDIKANDIKAAKSTIWQTRNISDQYLRFVIPDRKRRRIMGLIRNAQDDIEAGKGNAEQYLRSALTILENC